MNFVNKWHVSLVSSGISWIKAENACFQSMYFRLLGSALRIIKFSPITDISIISCANRGMSFSAFGIFFSSSVRLIGSSNGWDLMCSFLISLISFFIKALKQTVKSTICKVFLMETKLYWPNWYKHIKWGVLSAGCFDAVVWFIW